MIHSSILCKWANYKISKGSNHYCSHCTLHHFILLYRVCFLNRWLQKLLEIVRSESLTLFFFTSSKTKTLFCLEFYSFWNHHDLIKPTKYKTKNQSESITRNHWGTGGRKDFFFWKRFRARISTLLVKPWNKVSYRFERSLPHSLWFWCWFWLWKLCKKT